MKRFEFSSFYYAGSAVSMEPAKLLVRLIRPHSHTGSRQVLALIDHINAEQLAKECRIDDKMAFTRCILNEGVKQTLGVQCLIYLFDLGNGWCRDSNKRGDMLTMASKLVEKGVELEGISYYGKTIEQNIQSLINTRHDDPPASIDIVKRFTKASYNFDYPEPFKEELLQARIRSTAAVLGQLQRGNPEPIPNEILGNL